MEAKLLKKTLYFINHENPKTQPNLVMICPDTIAKVKGFLDLFSADLKFHDKRNLGEDVNEFNFRYTLATLKNVMGWSNHQRIYDSLVYLLEFDPDGK